MASLLRIGEFSQPSSILSYTIGQDNAISFEEINSENLSIQAVEGKLEFIPEVKSIKNETTLLLYNQIKKSGHYNITKKDTSIGGFSFNYNRDESDFSYFSNEELAGILAKSPIGNQVNIIEGADSNTSINVHELIQGKQFWWQCLFLALILLGVEIALIRIWK